MSRAGVATLALVIGLVVGTVFGVVVSQNFYEYHVYDQASGDTFATINDGGWQPDPSRSSAPNGFTFYYRRPRFRL